MSDIKVSLTMLVPGATMLSEQECSKYSRVPIINKKGKYAGKQARDRKGNLLWDYEVVPDLAKHNRHDLKVRFTTEDGKTETEVITYYTRKNGEAKKVLNISREAYEYFISNEIPHGFCAPKGFKPTKSIHSYLNKKTKKWVEGTPIEIQAWRAASSEQRLLWHLNSIAASMGGKVASYTVFND